VPSTPPLKAPAQFRLIGRPTRRLDGADKVYGRAVFGIDASPPGMKYASLALSPVEGGQVVTPLHEAAALAVRGVRQVVNEGDAVAVVADDTWAAMKGLEALKLRWRDGPNGRVQQADLVAALEAAAGTAGAPATRRGDVEAAMARAARRLDAVYHQPFLAHATMEPMNCTVHWHGGLCEVWVGTQAPDRAVAKLAALGLAPAQVRIHNHLIGGGFGRRLEVDGIVLAARIARHVPSPVKVLWRREEDIQHDRYRPYYVDRISAGLDAEGRPVAWRHTIAGSAVSELWSGEPNRNGVDDDAVTVAADPLYQLPNLEVRFVKQQPQGVPTSWWRGVGPTRSVFVVESFIDELAAAAGRDPVQYRRALIRDPRARAVLDAAVAHSDWTRPRGAHRGLGVAVQSAFGSYLALVVDASVAPGKLPRVHRAVCALDCGQMINPDTLHAQLQGGVMFGLTAALTGEITIADGRVQQSNFNDYPVMRIAEAPRVDVHLIASSDSPGGVGETGTACAAAALCNAIHAAAGQRIRTLPVKRALGV
ncbi:MAG TPA: molybdopterin cofactor-binding domain-containing protein, partial [Steroidobacteraceae bacterium]|nr:molybdopterin cofactor-binding domain-containing protein [Steroidobacteraceae bacterium]